MHTLLDEINHEEAHRRRGNAPRVASVRSAKRGDGKGKAPPEIVRPGANADVFNDNKSVTAPITPKRKTMRLQK